MKNKEKVTYADFNQAMDELNRFMGSDEVSIENKELIAQEAEKMVERLKEMKMAAVAGKIGVK